MGAKGFNEDVMCPVVFREGTNVPPISGVFAPGVRVTGFYMELYHASDGHKWHRMLRSWVQH